MDPATCDRVYDLCTTWTNQERTIFIGRAKLKENVDRVMGYYSIGSAWSDGANIIPKRTVHSSHGIFPYKMMFFPLKNQLLIESWSNWAIFEQDLEFIMIPPRLDSIANQSEGDWLQDLVRFYQISPFNIERLPRKKSSQYSSIRVNWSQIFMAIGLAVRFDQ